MRTWTFAFGAFLATSAAACGGAMSPEAYGRFGAEVSARNEVRHQRASAELEARGYRFAPDEERVLSISGDTRERCVRMLDANDADAVERVSIVPTTPAAREASEPLELTVRARDVCGLFRGTVTELDGLRSDDSVEHIVRIVNESLARDPEGALVLVQSEHDVIQRHDVLVEQHCNLMPSPGDPLGPLPYVRVVLAAARPASVVARHEIEEVNMRCTQNSH